MSTNPMERLNAALEGRYEIERELGEGGMATVYLAKDLKHNRHVALKVLKPELAAVVGAERFLAEIETTANLQHPHILPLFDSGEADSFLFYVMPFVEGETLQERIDREKQLPVDEAVRIAIGVANALQTAHERGIVHRDIKPANILLSRGEPLVADFGIALAVGAAGGSRLTETGLSVGTPYYMSPEQATGDQSVGPASDTYALACVLYEMLTGDPPYIGSTAQAVLGKIIQGAPVSATAMRKSIPANVDAAIRKALEKFPADRFGGAEDFAKALADPGFSHGDALVSAAAAPGHWKVVSAALAVVSAGLAAGLALAVSRPEPPDPVARFATPFRAEHAPVNFGRAAFDLSPDGSFLVYRGPDEAGVPGNSQLWLRRWEDVDATPLANTVIGLQMSVSPDGRQIAFRQGGGIKVINADGGAVTTLAEEAFWPRWGPDGFVYFVTGLTAARVPSTGGVPETLIDELPEGYANIFLSQIMASGKHALIDIAGPSGVEIGALDLESGELTLMVPGTEPRYTDSGHLVFLAAGNQLIATPFDPDAMEIAGSPVPVVEGVGAFTVSDNGDLVYVTTGGQTGQVDDTELVWVTRSGGVEPVGSSGPFDRGGGNFGWRLSPNDSEVAFRRRTSGNQDIWIKELPDGPLRRLTFAEDEQRVPWWTPDGQSVLYMSGPFGARHVWSRNADGTGTPTVVVDEGSWAEGLFSPDGEWLVLRFAGLIGGAEGDRAILALRPGVDEAPVPLIETGFVEQSPTLSPDGRWIAYESNETGQSEVFVRPFPDVDGGKWQLSANGGVGPRWSHGGEEIFFIEGRSMMAARVETEPSFRVVGAEELFVLDEDVLIGDGTDFYDVSADDQRFLMGRELSLGPDGQAPEYILVQNFVEELRRRVPN